MFVISFENGDLLDTNTGEADNAPAEGHMSKHIWIGQVGLEGHKKEN